ncbi:MAG: 3-phosphoshikimate 1-carboxyvinyltransferase [Rhizobacter sp.]|nr:3-phosphoshikimate 1-carboxyvinyltransferase [Chlorobiales bacterium]
MPRTFKGTVTSLPPDKSISHRSALIAAISEGTTEIENYSGGLDNQTTLGALQQLGVAVHQEISGDQLSNPRRKVRITGGGLRKLASPAEPLQCGNSGSTMRMLSGILAAQPFTSTLIGDDSLMQRPMKRIVEPLSEMGASFTLSETGTAPVVIHGTTSLKPISLRMTVPSAQVKSAVIFAGFHAEGITEIIEPVSTRNHTELMLGLKSSRTSDGATLIRVYGGRTLHAKVFHIPADPSAACFLVALGVLGTGNELLLKDVCLNPTRISYLSVLQDAGASITFENERILGGESIGDVIVKSSPIKPLRISGDTVAALIDELPMLAVLSAMATNAFELRGAAELRAKESDRIAALVVNLQAMGFRCDEFPDGFSVAGRANTSPAHVSVRTFHDHRIAMSFFIASRFTDAAVSLDDADCAAVSFPNFFDLIQSLEV